MSLLTPLYRVAQIRAKEKALLSHEDLSLEALMARAGAALWSVLSEQWAQAKRCVVVCGAGHNGGDGWVLAKLAHEADMSAQVLSVVPIDQLTGLTAKFAKDAVDAGVSVNVWGKDEWPEADVVVDALLGIGCTGAVREPMLAIIKQINAMHVPVFAVDVPSGLCADTGAAVQGAVKAMMTVTLVGHKVGLHTADGRDVSGMVVCQDLGSVALDEDEAQQPVAYLQQHWDNALPRRSSNSHKGQFGHVFVAGGDPGMGGASLLAAMAAYRLGAGKVTMLAWDEQVAGILAASPACMTVRLGAEALDFDLPAQTNAVVLGVGLGRTDSAQKIWQHVMDQVQDMALVLDADGLHVLHVLMQAPRSLPSLTVLTPHPGEAAALLQQSTADVQADRIVAAQAIADKYRAVCVLKGAGTVVAQPDQLPWVLPVGNASLAKAGCGDVLAGMIVALMAQGLAPWESAVMAVGLHGKAAEEATAHLGMRAVMPDDLLQHFCL